MPEDCELCHCFQAMLLASGEVPRGRLRALLERLARVRGWETLRGRGGRRRELAASLERVTVDRRAELEAERDFIREWRRHLVVEGIGTAWHLRRHLRTSGYRGIEPALESNSPLYQRLAAAIAHLHAKRHLEALAALKGVSIAALRKRIQRPVRSITAPASRPVPLKAEEARRYMGVWKKRHPRR